MKKIIFACLVFFLIYESALASTTPENVMVLDASDTSITLDWSDVSASQGYYLYYGTKTASGGKYEMEIPDVIDESEYVIENLNPQTSYFIALTSIDGAGNESQYSQEIEFQTLTLGQKNIQEVLRVMQARARDAQTLELLFSRDINPDASIDLRLQQESGGKEIFIDVSDVDTTNSKNIISLVSEPLTENTRYKITVLDIQDTSGKNIEAGVNALLRFTTPASFEEKGQAQTPELNAAPVEETQVLTKSTLQWNNAGTTLSGSQLANSVTQVAQTQTKLPQTGPAEWILLLVSCFFGGLIWMFQRKRRYS